MTESVCSTMNVRSPKPWHAKHGVTHWQYFRFTVDMFFVFVFFISLMGVWLEKLLFNLVICIHKRAKTDCFRRVHKILRWIGSSDFKQCTTPNIAISLTTFNLFNYFLPLSHFIPWIPLSHPFGQLPVTWSHCSPFLHSPQVRVHPEPYV